MLQESHPVLQGLPVLVVEDDGASASFLSVLLTSAGCQVRIAPSAEYAVETLRFFGARVVLLDLVLPRMSGLLLAEQLKANPDTRDLLIIAVSVMDGAEAQRLALATGCAAFIQKPVDPLTFPATLAQHVARATVAGRTA